MTFRGLEHCRFAAHVVVNVTGPETVSMRTVAQELGKGMGIDVECVGEEEPNVLPSKLPVGNRLLDVP